MNLYHSWLYEHVVNSKYMIWTIVFLVMGFNFLCPIFLWLTFAGRKIKFGLGKKNITQE